MKATHIDVDGKKVSMPLLENGVKLEIVKKKQTADEHFSPLLRQVSSLCKNNFRFCFERIQITRKQQLIGCTAPLLSMVALGNVIGYSSTLLAQLELEDKSIEINLSDGSWIGGF